MKTTATGIATNFVNYGMPNFRALANTLNDSRMQFTAAFFCKIGAELHGRILETKKCHPYTSGQVKDLTPNFCQESAIGWLRTNNTGLRISCHRRSYTVRNYTV